MTDKYVTETMHELLVSDSLSTHDQMCDHMSPMSTHDPKGKRMTPTIMHGDQTT